MKARDLPPFVQPEAAPIIACRACQVFRAEVQGGFCRICAHHVYDHGTAISCAADGRCECLPWEIYPRSRFGDVTDFEKYRDDFLAQCPALPKLRRGASGR